MKKISPLSSLLAVVSLISPLSAEIDRPAKPNIVVLLIDDLGWQDVKCYDVDEPTLTVTPNMDELAKMGVLFRQAYSPAPTCTPSRAAIVSGMHPARSQCTHINGGTLPKNAGKQGALVIPWYSGRMSVDQPSIAATLKAGGYATGMTGKWHASADLYSYPQPEDVGFDVSTHNEKYMLEKYGSHVKGIQEDVSGSKKKTRAAKVRPIKYSTKDSQYPLDENGYPVDPVQVETLEFIKNHKDKPFFLYSSSWLVHAPIQCRSEEIVMKYYNAYLAEMEATNKKRLAAGKKALPVEPLLDVRWSVRGKNPFYLGMVETMDYYIGQTIDYLKSTDDPRWPGHKLIENTYVVLTSDNGGVISARAEQITDNAPLRLGKKYTNEGGIRVPFIVVGPDIPAGVDSNVMINGLDIYPTSLSWAGLDKGEQTILDGADLSTLLEKDPKDSSLVVEADGKKRTQMFWHFPHATQPTTLVRDAEYKLIMNYGHQYSKNLSEFELYHLYDENGKRVDIEENTTIDDQSRIQNMHQQIEAFLKTTNATKPHFDPKSPAIHDGKNKLVPTFGDVQTSNTAGKVIKTAKYKENGASIAKAHLIYKMTSKHGVEWFREEMTIDREKKTVSVEMPSDATGAILTLIDENDFIVTTEVNSN